MVNWAKVGQFTAKFASKAFKWITAAALGYEIGNSLENNEHSKQLMIYESTTATLKKSNSDSNESVETILTMSVVMIAILCIAYLMRFFLRIMENRFNLRGPVNQAVVQNP